MRFWDTFPTLTCNGKIEVFKIFDLSGAFTGCRTVIVGFEEIRKSQFHVRDGCSPIVTIVRSHSPDKEILKNWQEWKPTVTALGKAAYELKYSKWHLCILGLLYKLLSN